MPIVVGGHVQVEVQADLLGEDCFNTFCYRANSGTGGTLTAFLAAFRALWRAQIIPLVTDQYEAEMYLAKELLGAIWKSNETPPQIPPVWPFVTPLLRWSDQAELAGAGAADTGAVVTAEMPSAIAVGAVKKCGPTTTLAGAAVPYSKFLKGDNRFGGLPEASTDDAAGNVLNAAAIAAWQAALDALKSPTLDGTTFSLEVWSLYDMGAARAIDGLPAITRATVINYTVKEDVTTQVTRKPRRGQ